MPRPSLSRIAVVLVFASILVSIPPALPSEAATFEVNTTDDTDDGVCDSTHCSLREAINAANTAIGPNTVAFDIGGGGQQTIQPNSSGLGALPVITDPIAIDGTTQPGYAGEPIIELNGDLSPVGDGLALYEGASLSAIRGLVVNGFDASIASRGIGVYAGVEGVVIDANYVGTDITGSLGKANSTGICLCEAADNHIGGDVGNLVSGNGIGIDVRELAGEFFAPIDNFIASNLIGTDATGTVALSNDIGVHLFNTNSSGRARIGGDENTRNIISGNGTGILIATTISGGTAASARPNILENYIGTDVTGTAAISNGDGIVMVGHGQAVIAGNLISGNNGIGIRKGAWGAAIISGNFIGVDVTGYRVLANGSHGIVLTTTQSSIATTVGTNVISGNGGDGINATFARFGESHIEMNLVGLAADGASPLGNGGAGIRYALSGLTTNDIPATGSLSSNTVAYNVVGGVLVDGLGSADAYVTLTRNQVFDNAGVDLQVSGMPGVAPPVLNNPQGIVVGATTCPGCLVEIFSGGGREFIVARGADAQGVMAPFDLQGTFVATSTGTDGRTSAYSDSLQTGPTDNCWWETNPDQANADANHIDVSPPLAADDATWITSDEFGDACDGDDDNDGLSDEAEADLGPGGAFHHLCPSTTGPTNPQSRDSDNDLALDGAECMLGTDPTDPSSLPPATPAGDTDGDKLPDWLELQLGTDPMNPDTDGDGIRDGLEYRNYNSNPLSPNTDGDRCVDGKELASVDGNFAVTAADLGLIASAIGSYTLPLSPADAWRANADMDKNGTVTAADLGFTATQLGAC